jgi:hypothetical protein
LIARVAEIERANATLDEMDAAAFSRIQGRIGDPGQGAAAVLGEVGFRTAITDQEPPVILQARARVGPLQPGAKGAHLHPRQGPSVIGRGRGLTKLLAYV